MQSKLRAALSLLAILILLGSCSALTEAQEFLESAELPVNEPEKIAASMTEALKRADLNGDGKVSGLTEWAALIREIVERTR